MRPAGPLPACRPQIAAMPSPERLRRQSSRHSDPVVSCKPPCLTRLSNARTSRTSRRNRDRRERCAAEFPRASIARLLAPLAQAFDGQRAFGIHAAFAAAGTARREFFGQFLELVDVDRRRACRAREHAALVGRFRRTLVLQECHADSALAFVHRARQPPLIRENRTGICATITAPRPRASQRPVEIPETCLADAML